MPPLRQSYRLQGYSLESIVRAYEVGAVETASTLMLHGRKLKPGPLLSAIVLEWLAMPLDKRTEFARKGVAKLETAMETAGTTSASLNPNGHPTPPAKRSRPNGKG